MPVFTVMAESADGEPFKLHRSACDSAREAIARVGIFRDANYRNIEVYRETERLNEAELRNAAETEKPRR